MTDIRKSAIALLAGSLGGLVTMAIHPTASAHLTAEQASHLALTSGIAHSLAIISFILVFLGVCGLLTRVSFPAVVVYAFACIAILIAATVSGFIVPTLLRHMVHDLPSAAPQWRITIDAIFQINQAFAKIYAVATSVSILLWSLTSSLQRAIAIYGRITAPLLIIGVAIGHLQLDVHGLAVIVICQALWFIAIGIHALRPAPY